MTAIKQVKEAFKVMKERNWEKVYFLFDIHGTIIKPSYKNLSDNKEIEFYPYAQEALELITNDREIVNILWSCSHDDELDIYNQFFHKLNINFKYINHNPEVNNTKLSCFDSKMYYSAGFDDKFGFDPLTDWEDMYNYFFNRQIGKNL